MLMGGRVAELVVFDQLTTGAGNDLERATKLARKMVCNWGMSEELGPATFGKTEEHIFLGKEMAQSKDFSESTAEIIDQEIKRFMLKAENVARSILEEHLDKLHKLAAALLEREILDSAEVDVIIGRTSGDTEPVEATVPTPEN
jgi:cell division protease FtsH